MDLRSEANAVLESLTWTTDNHCSHETEKGDMATGCKKLKFSRNAESQDGESTHQIRIPTVARSGFFPRARRQCLSAESLLLRWAENRSDSPENSLGLAERYNCASPKTPNTG